MLILVAQTCLKNINAGVAFPGRREDFESDAAWHHWRTLETTQLQQLMVAMVQFNPELAKSTPAHVLPNYGSNSPRPASMYTTRDPLARQPSSGSRVSMFDTSAPDDDDDEEVQAGHNFTYIPPNPKRFYKRLLEICLLADLERMLSPEVDDNDEVSLGILSPAHHDLLNECAVRWRIDHPYRAACFLDLVRQFYERNDVPLECVPEALQNVQKVIHDRELEQWTVSDVCLRILGYVCSSDEYLHRWNFCAAFTAASSIFSSHRFITPWKIFRI